MNNARLPARIVRQRGTFAFLATVLLLVVVAVAIRLVLGSSQSTTYATTTAGQSVQAYLLGASAQQRAVAILKSAPLNSGGFLNAADCTSINSVGSGSYGLGTPSVGNVQFTALTPTDPGCDSVVPNTCTGCNVQVTATVGSASRVLNLSVAVNPSPGVTDFGMYITERLRATVAPSAAVFNLAYRRQMAGIGGGQATLITCNSCTELWDIQSSSGSPSVGGEGVYASLLDLGTYTITQTLSDNRNYVEVGLQFSGTSVDLVGSYRNDSGGQGKMTIGTGNTVTGQTTNGAVNDTDWCRGGTNWKGPSSGPFADTLVFGFSGRATTKDDGLSSVTFNSANPVTLQAPPPARFVSYAGDMYSEIWVWQNPDYTAKVALDANVGATAITVTSVDPSTPVPVPVKGTLLAVQTGSGQFQPGTTVIGFDSTTSTISFSPSKALNTTIKSGAFICGGTCAFFDHTTNGNTSFSVVKSAGTTQWAAGFTCLKGSPTPVPTLQGIATPVFWEPF